MCGGGGEKGRESGKERERDSERTRKSARKRARQRQTKRERETGRKGATERAQQSKRANVCARTRERGRECERERGGEGIEVLQYLLCPGRARKRVSESVNGRVYTIISMLFEWTTQKTWLRTPAARCPWQGRNQSVARASLEKAYLRHCCKDILTVCRCFL